MTPVDRRLAGALALAAAALAAAAPAAAADGTIDASPTPVPAGGQAEVAVRFPVAVEEADLRACRADAGRAILSCYTPVEMSPGDGENWTATIPPEGGFGEAAYAGLNATGRTAGGEAVHVPGGGEVYRFVAVAAPQAESPGPGALAAVVGLAGAAAVAGVRGQP